MYSRGSGARDVRRVAVVIVVCIEGASEDVRLFSNVSRYSGFTLKSYNIQETQWLEASLRWQLIAYGFPGCWRFCFWPAWPRCATFERCKVGILLSGSVSRA